MYTTTIWDEWLTQELKNYVEIYDKKSDSYKKRYLKKGYLHFDERFWLPQRKKELRSLLENNLVSYNKITKKKEYWSFSPFLKILLKTPRYKYQEDEGVYDLETKIRPICFASHIDSLIFGFYGFALTKVYEKYIKDHVFDECVLAYRSDLGKCNIQFAKEVIDEVRSRKECGTIALDIKGYFDNIDHVILKEKWAKVLGEKIPFDQYKLYKVLTEYSYVVKSHIYRHFKIIKQRQAIDPRTLLDFVPAQRRYEQFNILREHNLIVVNRRNKIGIREKGIPQGSALSALLSNIYLIDFDEMMSRKAKAEGFVYRRYCDDILIICSIQDVDRLKSFTIDSIKSDYLLNIQDKKVETIVFKSNIKGKIRAFSHKKLVDNARPITSKNEQRFYKSLQYLGFEFNGQDIFIRSSSVSRYYRKLKARVSKTVAMAYGKKGKADQIFKEKLLHRYTHLGKRNFLKYAYNAAGCTYINAQGETKDGLCAPSIKKQVSRHMNILINVLLTKNEQRTHLKRAKNQFIEHKRVL
ncbi:reverse transcriptase domain-containing protein [Chitinophaga sp. CC14]|uniref:reverse transcriptase domain-containing protein n=1 Tax=Chitinophaga sp. CC14 TaxID=3029199 RepID=UPI003B7DE0A2